MYRVLGGMGWRDRSAKVKRRGGGKEGYVKNGVGNGLRDLQGVGGVCLLWAERVYDKGKGWGGGSEGSVKKRVGSGLRDLQG